MTSRCAWVVFRGSEVFLFGSSKKVIFFLETKKIKLKKSQKKELLRNKKLFIIIDEFNISESVVVSYQPIR